MDTAFSTRRVTRVRHELRRRELTVRRVDALGPGFVAVTFGGEALEGFVSASFDDHVKLILDASGPAPVMRDYTPAAFDAASRELILEFALHGHGPASDWARTVAVGDTAVVAGPRGSMVIPVDYDWHLLAGDATALPAMRRRLRELPAGAHVTVIAEVAPGDRNLLAGPHAARVQLQWVDTGDALVRAVQDLTLPPGEGFAWAAGEAATMARVRQVLLTGKHHPKEALRVAAYWKQGATAHHQNLED